MPDFGATSISGLENVSKYRQAVSAANYLVNDAVLDADLAWNTAKDQVSAAEYAGGQQRQANIFGSVMDAAVSAGSGFAYKSLRTPTSTPTPTTTRFTPPRTIPDAPTQTGLGYHINGRDLGIGYPGVG